MAALGYFLILAIASKEIACWTVDLPEVRKYFFEKNEKFERDHGDNAEKVVYADVSSVGRKDFDNIRGDSPHNTEAKYYDEKYRRQELKTPEIAEISDDSTEDNNIYSGKYAEEYGYLSYMEKKVGDIVHNGTVYLDGLRRALERYGELLKNCSRNYPGQSSSSSSSPSPPSWLPENESPVRARPESEEERCEQATRESEHVRRLAALALWATRELQDKAYGDKYHKVSDAISSERNESERQLAALALWATRELQNKAYGDKYQKELAEEQEEEEKELLLRLAWFLDRLAALTGYEPSAEDFISPHTQRTTPTPLPGLSPAFNMTQPPSAPSTDRTTLTNCPDGSDGCRYPLQMPEEMQRMVKEQDSSAVSKTTRSDTSDIETLVEAENSDPMRKKSIKKRSINDSPLVSIMKYYAKYKAWTNSNQEQTEESTESYEQNHLTKSVQKRAIDAKKSIIHNHITPEDPMQDISQKIKHKTGVNYYKNEVESDKIKMYLDKIRHSDRLTAKSLVKKLQKRLKSIKKRSVAYGRKVQPSRSQDPQQDISYYVKNRRGTNYNYNQVQARQVRAGLEQIFQTGNIEVVRRYGANYNPLVPNTLMAGALQSIADF